MYVVGTSLHEHLIIIIFQNAPSPYQRVWLSFLDITANLYFVHSSLINVLLKFRFHRYPLTTDVSKMYCAIKLTQRPT